MREKELLLRRRMKDPIWRRLMDKSPAGTNPEALLNQARETAALKREIVDRMPALDPDHYFGESTDMASLLIRSLQIGKVSTHRNSCERCAMNNRIPRFIRK